MCIKFMFLVFCFTMLISCGKKTELEDVTEQASGAKIAGSNQSAEKTKAVDIS